MTNDTYKGRINIGLSHLKKYSMYTEVTSMEKVLEELSFKFDFVFRKLQENMIYE